MIAVEEIRSSIPAEIAECVVICAEAGAHAIVTEFRRPTCDVAVAAIFELLCEDYALHILALIDVEALLAVTGIRDVVARAIFRFENVRELSRNGGKNFLRKTFLELRHSGE